MSIDLPGFPAIIFFGLRYRIRGKFIVFAVGDFFARGTIDLGWGELKRMRFVESESSLLCGTCQYFD